MASHKSKLERFRDICEAVYFSEEKGIKAVPYQVAKEIGYPQSHTTSYMNELARKKILIKNRNGVYSLPNFRSQDDLEKAEDKLQLSKYYSWEILNKLRKELKGEEPEYHRKPRKEQREVKEDHRLTKKKDDLDEEISHILDVIEEFPLSFFVVSKKDMLKFIEQEILKLRKASTQYELKNIQFNIDMLIKILEDSAKVVK